MASPPEDIELQVMAVGDPSDTTSETGESVEGFLSSSSDDDDSGSSSSDDSPVPVSTVDKGKQRAGEPPKSILKKDKGKDTASSEDWKSSNENKHCARCGRAVKKPHHRWLDRPSSNVTDKQAVVKNTIHNLEIYATTDPVAVLCDRCGAAASKLDQYKNIAVEGERLVRSHLTHTMSKNYAREVIAREKFFAALNEKSTKKRSSGKPAPAATVSFTVPSPPGKAGVQSDDAASVISSVIRVSIDSLPPPVDGVGAVMHRHSFDRVQDRHYERGRWSWEAARERGDLEEYDDNSSNPRNSGESSARGAGQGESQEKKEHENSSRGWLDTSGSNVKYHEFYGTPKTKEDKEEEKKEKREAALTRPQAIPTRTVCLVDLFDCLLVCVFACLLVCSALTIQPRRTFD